MKWQLCIAALLVRFAAVSASSDCSSKSENNCLIGCDWVDGTCVDEIVPTPAPNNDTPDTPAPIDCKAFIIPRISYYFLDKEVLQQLSNDVFSSLVS
jgi:hypothetical protein